jgi:hypothetical protein
LGVRKKSQRKKLREGGIIMDTYTQKEFATAVGISTATVANMLKNGTLKRAANGRIPKEELQRYFENMIKSTSKGTYILTFDKTEDEIDSLKYDFESSCTDKDMPIPAYFDSISQIMEEAGKDSMTDIPSDDSFLKQMQIKYNRAVFDAFITQYKSKAFDYLNKVIYNDEVQDFKKLPSDIAYDLVFYGRVLSEGYSDDEIQCCMDLLGDNFKIINDSMNGVFNALMRELMLLDTNKQLLFTRNDLTYEFLHKEGDLYEKFFYKKDGDNRNKREYAFLIQHNQKILQSVTSKAKGRTIKGNIQSLLGDGFYTVCNVKTTNELFINNIVKMLGSGFYSRVLIAASENEFKKFADGYVWLSARNAVDNNIITIEYLK